MKSKNILKELYNKFDKRGFCTNLDEDCEFLYVHHGLSTIYIQSKKTFNLSFEVNCDATASASVTQELIKFATKNKMKVDIYEPYAYIVDENNPDKIKGLLFGEEAIEYWETGQVPVKKEDEKKETVGENDDVNPQAKVDAILDQISKTGMESLKKHDKEFLLKFSKDNHKH